MFDLGALSEENWIRVLEQNEKTISVIIGNPPYNDSAVRWGDGSENRGYADIDRRMKEAYVDNSTAQKTHQYDMYKRFIRWASDRLADDGIVTFVTNRAYLNAFQDDGFRKKTTQEFSEIYVLDLGSDVRRNPTISGTKHNVFGIQTGVAIGFFVRNSSKIGQCSIYYSRREDAEPAKDKLDFLSRARLEEITFDTILPDVQNRWFNQPNNDFGSLMAAVKKRKRAAQGVADQDSVFAFHCNAAKSNRDDWVYDFSGQSLRDKTGFFIKTYNELLDSHDYSFAPIIKWSEATSNYFQQRSRMSYKEDNHLRSLFRPFVKKHYFADAIIHDRLTSHHRVMFGSDLKQANPVPNVCVSGKHSLSPWLQIAGRLSFCWR